MTEVAEQFLIDILTPALASIPVRRQVADADIVRPIVIVTGKLAEIYVPDGRYSVAKIDLETKLETQVGQTSDTDHIALISLISVSLPNYGLWTTPQTYYEKVYFGPLQSQQETINELVRSYVFGFYLVGRLTIPSN